MTTSEFSKIARIEAILRRECREVSLSMGDDCAVLRPTDEPRVWTVDSAVAGVHFSRDFMALDHIAQRAFAAAASDVAAMGGRAVAALSALTLPRAFTDDELTELVTGLARASDRFACPIVGGNLARGSELSLTTTVLGECPGRVLTRSGAQLGDSVFVTGTVGGAALGLRALSARRASEAAFLPAIEQFLTPVARLDVALEVAEVASAAIDVSDGLLQDLGHLCRASQVGARIETASLPLLSGFVDAAASLRLDALALALEGGEDYQLLFTAPREAVPARLATCIGRVVAVSEGVLAYDANGRARAPGTGFDHFAS